MNLGVFAAGRKYFQIVNESYANNRKSTQTQFAELLKIGSYNVTIDFDKMVERQPSHTHNTRYKEPLNPNSHRQTIYKN